MADIDLERAHGLGLAAAREAADRAADHLRRKFGLRGAWDGDMMRFERPGLSGFLQVTARELRLSVTLGLLLKAMKPSIERAVAEELDAIVAKGAGGGARQPPTRPGASRKKGR